MRCLKPASETAPTTSFFLKAFPANRPFNFLIYTPERSGSGGKLEVARAFAPRAELLILIDDGSDALQEFSEFERGAAIGIRLPRKPTAPSVRYVANLAEAAEHCLAYFQ